MDIGQHKYIASPRQAYCLFSCGPSVASENGLQLDSEKSEVVFLGTTAQLQSDASIVSIVITVSKLCAKSCHVLCTTIPV